MAAEAKIARTVAEAQVGDLLWVRRDRWRKCPWELWPVRKVGRTYCYVGDHEGDWSWVKAHREQPYDDNREVMGHQQRAECHLRAQERKIVERLRKADLDTLRTVAFALGLDDAPDFSAAPRADGIDPERGRDDG